MSRWLYQAVFEPPPAATLVAEYDPSTLEWVEGRDAQRIQPPRWMQPLASEPPPVHVCYDPPAVLECSTRDPWPKPKPRWVHRDAFEPPQEIVSYDQPESVWEPCTKDPWPKPKLRWIFRDTTDAPLAANPNLLDPTNMAWDDRMDDPFNARELRAVTGPEAQSRARRWVYPDLEAPVPSLFTLFDAFEMTVWDGSQGSMGQSAAMSRGIGNQGNKGKKDEDKGKKYGEAGWILGLSEPWGPGASPPWGPGGVPPLEQDVGFWHHSRWPAFRSPRRPVLPIESPHEPLWFGDERMRVEWEPQRWHNLHRKFVQPNDYQIETETSDEEGISLDKWYAALTQNYRRLPPAPLPRIESLLNLTTDEDVADHVDKWDNSLMRLMPVLPRQPISAWPFRNVVEDQEGEAAGLDKWYRQFDDPVRAKHQLRLLIGVLNSEPIPDADLLPTAIPYWKALAYDFRRNRLLPLPPMESFVNLQTAEEVAERVDKWDGPLMRLMPVRPREPVNKWPFRKEVEDQEPEAITLDKWYTLLPQNYRRLPPAPLPPLERYRIEADEETITLDKWYSMTLALMEYTHRARRCVSGPEGQTDANTRVTAPWIEMSRLDPFPIPDIPGYEFWFTRLSEPVRIWPPRLRLYDRLQIFQWEPYVRPCENPRRRPDQRRVRTYRD